MPDTPIYKVVIIFEDGTMTDCVGVEYPQLPMAEHKRDLVRLRGDKMRTCGRRCTLDYTTRRMSGLAASSHLTWNWSAGSVMRRLTANAMCKERAGRHNTVQQRCGNLCDQEIRRGMGILEKARGG